MGPSRHKAGQPSWARAFLAATLLVAGGFVALAASATPVTVSGGVGLAGVRFGGDATVTRMVLDLDAAVAGRILAAESAPDRLVIALPSILSAGPLGGRGQGLVTAWSLKDDGRGARLILAVSPGATANRRFLIPPTQEGGRWRYVIDIQDDDPLAILAASPAPRGPGRPALAAAVDQVRSAAPASAAPPRVAVTLARAGSLAAESPSRPAPGVIRVSGVGHLQAAARPGSAAPVVEAEARADSPPVGGTGAGPWPTSTMPRATPGLIHAALVTRLAPRDLAGHARRVIVVDAGHGGHDPGARSLVRNEKDLTLAAALALKARLEKIGRYKVVLTRDTDVFIPLEERVRIARRVGADLFISLHADSAGADPTPHGASIYTLSDSGQTRVNYVLGPHEWFSNAGGKRADPGVRQILLDLTQRSTRNRSAQFASVLIGHISDRVDLLPRTHRDAGYFVLLAPDVPAVLLEMGFITNPADEMRLTDPAQRDALMGGVADAIDAYFSGETRLAAG